MNKIGRQLSFTVLSLILISCGTHDVKKDEQKSALMATANESSNNCTFIVEKNESGQVTQIVLKGSFVVDYKVATPGSGIYGKQQWDGTFDSLVNFKSQLVKVRRSFLGDADVIEGLGKPLFWDSPEHDHKLVIKPSLAAPRTVHYSASSKFMGLSFVTIDNFCTVSQ